MRKITRKIYFIILCVTVFTLNARGMYYNDRLMIYIDNKVSDFRIEDDQLTTSIADINYDRSIDIFDIFQLANILMHSKRLLYLDIFDLDFIFTA